MTNWLYQIRIKVSEQLSHDLRSNEKNEIALSIRKIAQTFGMNLVCTFDAFKAYCDEAEKFGTSDYHLYDWTKATIDNPVKKEKHLKSFAFYQGENQIYSKQLACRIRDELFKINENKHITEISLIDSNPANNPQPPKS